MIEHPYRNAFQTAHDLGIARSTLDSWLSRDQARGLEDRRLTFHAYRGRKRVWSEKAFQQLQAAIEKESGPGGVLGGWRARGGRTDVPTAQAAAALQEVLAYSPGRPERNFRRNDFDGPRAEDLHRGGP